jgi:hypothetical protein
LAPFDVNNSLAGEPKPTRKPSTANQCGDRHAGLNESCRRSGEYCITGTDDDVAESKRDLLILDDLNETNVGGIGPPPEENATRGPIEHHVRPVETVARNDRLGIGVADGFPQILRESM